MKNLPLIIISFLTILFANIGICQELLDVEGAIKVSDSNDDTPEAGTIRWNPNTQDFEGYDGVQWLSLTKLNQTNLFDSLAANSSSSAGGYGMGYCLETQLLRGQGSSGFGSYENSISVDSNCLAIGAPFYDVNNSNNNGAVLLYKLQDCSWVESDTLLGNKDAGQFGYSVAVNNNYLAVGAPNDLLGKVFLYHHSGGTWNLQDSILAPDPDDQKFGFSVDMDWPHLIVGSPGSQDIFFAQGLSYVYTYNGSNWVLEDVLAASDRRQNDQFGTVVKISGQTAVIGSKNNDIVGEGTDRGRAYVYNRTDTLNWVESSILDPDISRNFQFFGSSIDFDRKSIIVSDFADAGKVNGFIYTDPSNTNNWTLTQRIDAKSNPDGAACALFCDDLVLASTQFCQVNSMWKKFKYLHTTLDGAEFPTFIYEIEMDGDYVFMGTEDFFNPIVLIYSRVK